MKGGPRVRKLHPIEDPTGSRCDLQIIKISDLALPGDYLHMGPEVPGG
jgi:hypothetical protein